MSRAYGEERKSRLFSSALIVLLLIPVILARSSCLATIARSRHSRTRLRYRFATLPRSPLLVMLFAPPYKIFSLMQTIAQKKFGLALQRRYLYANLLYINAYVKGFLLNSPDHSKLCRLLAKKVDGLLT